jgi:hypothetical protein
MKNWLLFIALFLCLFLAVPSESATYCLSNSGAAGSKTVVTDCSNMANCMDEAVFNGETFSGDTVLVCPNDGDLDLGVEIDQTVYLEGVYSSTYGIPTFSAGLNATAGTNPSVKGVRINLGVAESGTKTFEGGRFADDTRSWQASEETVVVDWNMTKAGIFAVGLGATGGAVNNLTPQLYWRNKTDAGSFATVGVSGEVKYTTVAGLTDNNDVTSGEAGVSSGKSYTTCNQCEQEDSHQASTTTDLAADNWGELQVGVSFADGDGGDEYEFALFESAAQVGSASLTTVTIETPCVLSGASGTYLGWWLGEYPDDTNEACLNSGR